MSEQSSNPNFSLKHIVRKNEFDYNANKKAAHYHNHYELYYFLGDEMNYFVDNRSIPVKKKDIVLIAPHVYHRSRYYDSPNQERILISFSEKLFGSLKIQDLSEKIRDTFRRNWIHITDGEIKARIHNMIKYICDTYEKHGNSSLDRISLMMGELVLYLNEIIHLIPKDNSLELLSSSDRHIYEIVNFINSEYMNKITLDSLAERFFISKYYLCRMFKNVMGMSIVEFINTKRISEAAYLLQNTDKPISEVAVSAGFNSHSFFIQLFKKMYNTTPRQYRINSENL